MRPRVRVSRLSSRESPSRLAPPRAPSGLQRPEIYDTLGRTYTHTRREDPRIACAIHRALGDANSVLNVGAGTGSYEPSDRNVQAVEPSETMIAQRGATAAPVVRAHAERLPFPDRSFDATMAVLSDHHWTDRAAGLRELKRVARHRAVVLTWDPSYADEFWLTRDYLPTSKRLSAASMPLAEVAAHLGATRIEPVPIAHDCRDGFYMAFWRRPQAYLEQVVRDGISVFALLPAAEVRDAVRTLESDLRNGRWHERNAALLDEEEHDYGYRLLIAER